MVGLTEMLSCKNLDGLFFQNCGTYCVCPLNGFTPETTRAQLNLLCFLYYFGVTDSLNYQSVAISKNNLETGSFYKSIEVVNERAGDFNEVLGRLQDIF